MARRADFSFQHRQRELAKAAKRAAKRDARAAKKLGEPAPPDDDERWPDVVRLPKS